MSKTTGTFETLHGQAYYKIENSQNMQPFFINVASNSDVWLFMSSKGGITAGRKNAGGALFPYETDDKLHASAQTGSRTIVKVGSTLWEPFERTEIKKFAITQNIYKSVYGCSILFEEVNHDLNLCFRYQYASSEAHGLIKTSEIINLSDSAVTVSVLDGLQNILPYGVNDQLQAVSSTLVDAYKASEFYGDLAVYSMTTLINDSPNPMEVLRASIAWSTKQDAQIALSGQAIADFCQGNTHAYNTACYGVRSCYFVQYDCTLAPAQSERYATVLDNGYSHSMIVAFSAVDFDTLQQEIVDGAEKLKSIVAAADGLQEGGDLIATNHHYLNTLYNVMRGGMFEDEYQLLFADFVDFVSVRNKQAFANKAMLDKLSAATTVHELKDLAKQDDVFYRLALEYMPLSFSRRHGDPSRPWNKFNINLKDDDGNKIRSYEGNWRDIFQNWEALGLSFPCYYENMIAKFVNASTVDGFNPYRINRTGIDWEKPEPDDPFAGLGYWGDHQIIYLLRLLQGLLHHFPAQLDRLLFADCFAYANVPYRINSYDEILKDSKNTIAFDFDRDAMIEDLCQQIGSDGRLVQHQSAVYTVNLTEKLLVSVLSKVSNLLSGGGIWMNTQRPEWNDANNAIVGIGLSMVTVYHVQSYLAQLQAIFADKTEDIALSCEVFAWMDGITKATASLDGAYLGHEKQLLDQMGQIFSTYRDQVYRNGFAGKQMVAMADIKTFLSVAKQLVDDTVVQNKHGIFSTYNLLCKDFTVKPMRPMLEGQSAVIGSGALNATQVCDVIDQMSDSLLDVDGGYHYLYPRTCTTPFIEKNTFKADLITDGIILLEDVQGNLHFGASMISDQVVRDAVQRSNYSEADQKTILDWYETIFAHGAFTGRSQVMYRFEGIGCAYWHQNAKMALAVAETAVRTYENGENANEIYDAYHKLVGGFVYRKSPAVCGAIPLEPYSHSSFIGKCEQPGMTGQVKESILMRRIELGVLVKQGAIQFTPYFVNGDEFDQNGKLSFTICGVPVTYQCAKHEGLTVTMADDRNIITTDMTLSAQLCRHLFERNQQIKQIVVHMVK